MALAATVLIPTHNHGRLLEYSIGSALGQTVSEIEVFVVGDGVDDATRGVVLEMVRRDARVRFFDFPKGPRHGEIHRHAALAEARGRIVCYLSDDDLWLPGHLEAMCGWLRDADFAHAVPLNVRPDGYVEVFYGHLSNPVTRERMMGAWNFIPLSNGGHTLEFYRRLPEGWRTTPAGIWTDLYMWRQILSVEGVRALSGDRATVLHFPSPHREGWTTEQRVAELERWGERLVEAGFEHSLARRVMEHLLQARFDAEVRVGEAVEQLRVERERLEESAQALHGEIETLQRAVWTARAELDAVRTAEGTVQETLADVREHSSAMDAEVARMRGTITWRVRDWLVRLPGVAAVVRAVAKQVSEPRDP